MLEAVLWENPTYGISGGAAGNVVYGGTVNPPRNRKGGAGNPPPTGARASALPNKAKRLRGIFGEDGTCRRGVTPHFVLMTAKRSKQINTESWPSWMTRHNEAVWLDYKIPYRRKITRCTAAGEASEKGRRLRLDWVGQDDS